MKLLTYKELLEMTKEAVDKSMIPLRTRSMRKKAELEVAKLDEEIATLQANLNQACSQKELNFEDIINRMDELELKERRLKQLNTIVEQLFPAEDVK